jgi:hypothetical protein
MNSTINRKYLSKHFLTKGQIEFLMDVHENEILGLPPITVISSMFANRLIKKGFLQIVPHVIKQKVLMIYRTTGMGVEYLNSISAVNSDYHQE